MKREFTILALITLATGVMVIAQMPEWKRKALWWQLTDPLRKWNSLPPVNLAHERAVMEFRRAISKWESDRNAS